MTDKSWTRLRGESIGEYELTSSSDRPYKETVSATVEEPSQSQHVRHLKRPIFEFVMDFVLATLPWLFISLAIAAQMQNYAPLDSINAGRVIDALRLGPTIFPIVFAALCGHFMKSLALYKCQSGLQMKHLEHLVGAQSIFSTLEKFFFLRNWNTIGILITLTWCLSPLGGQAFIRILQPSSSIDTSRHETNFLGPDALKHTEVEAASGVSDALPYVDGIYMSSITAPLSRLIGPLSDSAVATKFGSDSSGSYYGLVGIPVSGLSARADVSSFFEFQSLNLDVVCTSNVNTTLGIFNSNLSEPLYNPMPNNGTSPTIDWQKYWLDDMQAGDSTSFLFAYNQSVNDFLGNSSDKFQVFYGTTLEENGNPDPAAAVVTCDVSPLRLASMVSCLGQLCNVTSVRKVQTNLTDTHRNTLIGVLLSGAFAGTGSGGGLSTSSPTARYLHNPDTLLTRDPLTVPVNRVPLDVLSERMMVIFNTYYYVSTASWMWANDLASTLELMTQVEGYSYALSGVLNATATVYTPHTKQYEVQQIWFTLALVTSLLLEAIALANIALRWMTKIPDIFGYVSSLTLHNELCRQNGLAVSSALDGLERAAELGDVKFRIADVRSDSDIGRMAFVPVSASIEEQNRYGDVRLGRKYD